MAFQTAMLASDAYTSLRTAMVGWKAQAQNVLATAQSSNISSPFVFSMLDGLSGMVSSIAAWSAVAGLNSYATSQGYPGTMTTDTAATSNAAQNVIAWVTTNFPKDAQGFVQAYTLNADGTRTPASFTPTQTAGLQSALTSLIATIN